MRKPNKYIECRNKNNAEISIITFQSYFILEEDYLAPHTSFISSTINLSTLLSLS